MSAMSPLAQLLQKPLFLTLDAPLNVPSGPSVLPHTDAVDWWLGSAANPGDLVLVFAGPAIASLSAYKELVEENARLEALGINPERQRYLSDIVARHEQHGFRYVFGVTSPSMPAGPGLWRISLGSRVALPLPVPLSSLGDSAAAEQLQELSVKRRLPDAALAPALAGAVWSGVLINGNEEVFADLELLAGSSPSSSASPRSSGSATERIPEETLPDGRRNARLPVTTRLHTDSWSTDDRLGYELYAKAIAEFIRHRETVAPLTIGILAPWGQGKTTLMRMVQDHLRRSPSRVTTAVPTVPSGEDGGAPPAKPRATYRDLLRWMRAPLELKPRKLQYPTVWFNAWRFQRGGVGRTGPMHRV